MSKITINLNETSVGENLAEYLNENIEDIQQALSFSQCDQNDRVELGEVSVRSVNFLKDGLVEVEYEYEWSYFTGCKDINDAGIGVETIHGRLVDGKLEFDVWIPPDPRSTDEEF